MSNSTTRVPSDSPLPSSEKHIRVIDAARGFCALYVFLAHLEGVYHLRQLFPEWRYLIAISTDYAHAAVMVFFLLSGFSIHYSSLARPLGTREGLLHYYFLRIRRIYPIFLCAVVLTLILDVLGCTLRIGEYCSNLTVLSPGYLLQVLFFTTDRSYIPGILAPVLPGNSPLWSLSYEIAYYLIYPLFWVICRRFGNRVGLLLGFVISVVAMIPTELGYPNHVSNVLSLYCLWCMGAWIGGKRREGDGVTWPGWMLLFACYVMAQATWVLEFAGLGVFYHWLWGALCFGLMAVFLLTKDASTFTPIGKIANFAGIILGLMVILWTSTKIRLAPDSTFFYGKVIGTALLFGAVIAIVKVCSPERVIKRLLLPFAFAGAISYAVYIVHFPVIQFIAALEKANWTPSYWGLFIAPIISLALAYVLEIRWQPVFSQWLNRWRWGPAAPRGRSAVDI